MAEIIEYAANRYTEGRHSQLTALTVQALLTHFNRFLPVYRDLSVDSQFQLYQEMGYQLGVNHSYTYDVDHERQIRWLEKHGNVAIGFKKEVLEPALRQIPGTPDHWETAEPKVSGNKARSIEYSKLPANMRCYDFHFGIAISDDLPDPDKIQRLVQQSIWGNTFKFKDDNPNDPTPLDRRGRFAYHEPTYSPGWGRYSGKHVARTAEQHADVTSSRPTGASIAVKRKAKEFYDSLREAVNGLPDTPAGLIKDVADHIPKGAKKSKIRFIAQLCVVNYYPVVVAPAVMQTTVKINGKIKFLPRYGDEGWEPYFERMLVTEPRLATRGVNVLRRAQGKRPDPRFAPPVMYHPIPAGDPVPYWRQFTVLTEAEAEAKAEYDAKYDRIVAEFIAMMNSPATEQPSSPKIMPPDSQRAPSESVVHSWFATLPDIHIAL